MRIVQIGDYHIDADAVHVVSQTVSGQVMVHTPSGAVCVMGSTVAEVVARLKRGPTPCTSCRWFIDSNSKYEAFCTARQDALKGVGTTSWPFMRSVGCPQHEEK
jgi:hypothetical protein